MLTGSNLLMGFGSNKSFQLVSGDAVLQESLNRDHQDDDHLIMNPDEDFQNLDITRPIVVDLEQHISSNSVSQVICGDNCTFILTNEGQVWARGLNGKQCRFLGLHEDVEIAETFMRVTGELENELVVDIAAHPEVDTTFQLGHTLFLTESGKVYSTGCNTTGALCVTDDPLVMPTQVWTSGFEARVATHIAVSQRSSIIITDHDRLWLCGMTLEESEDSFRLQQPTDIGWDNEPISMIACGNSHCVILSRSGKVFSFGSNKHGQCGFPEYYQVHYPVEVTNPLELEFSKHKFVDISCKGNHTILLSANGSVWVFGNNDSGFLGMDTNGENIFMPTRLQCLSGLNVIRVDTGFRQSLFVTDNECFVCGEGDTFNVEPKPLEWNYNRTSLAVRSKPIYMKDNYMKSIGNGTDHFIIHFVLNQNVYQFKSLMFGLEEVFSDCKFIFK
ncbi:GTPase regulator [Acrasis kona]|uniref:GTPase regulator n=1 Tax=Acrasis kona TaxID=1008807 RepID=A0AAW2YJY6_9EUKA